MKLNIILKEDFIKNDYIKLSNIELIAYDREQGNRFLNIDITGDQISDLIDINGLKVESGNNRTDNFAPNEIFNLIGSLNNSGTILNLNWLNPGDFDFNGIKLESLDNDKKLLKEDFVYSTGTIVNITENIKSVFVKTFDRRGNTSNGIKYTISEIVEEEKEELVEEKETEIIEEDIVDKEEIVIDKIIPIFKTKSFSDFIIKFDKRLDKIEYKKELRIVRNDIIQLLKDYKDKKVGVKFVKSELERLVSEFRKVW